MHQFRCDGERDDQAEWRRCGDGVLQGDGSGHSVQFVHDLLELYYSRAGTGQVGEARGEGSCEGFCGDGMSVVCKAVWRGVAV